MDAPCYQLLSLSSLLCRTFAAHVIVQFTLRLLDKGLPSLSESAASHTLCGAFIFVCRQMYNTCEGLQLLRPYGLHKAIAAAWKKVTAAHLCLKHSPKPTLFAIFRYFSCYLN